jgi:hypothetical protein
VVSNPDRLASPHREWKHGWEGALIVDWPPVELSVEPVPRTAHRVKSPASDETGDGTEFGATAIATDARDDVRDAEPAGDRCQRSRETMPGESSRGNEESDAGCCSRKPEASRQRRRDRRHHLRIEGTRAKAATTQAGIA